MKRLFYTLDIEGNKEEIESRMKLQKEVKNKIELALTPIIKEYIDSVDQSDLMNLINSSSTLLCLTELMRTKCRLIKELENND